MIEFGATLRRAREAKGLSTNDVAKQTHMMVQQIEDLENENFSKIAAPIYGRGFVKLYCEAVGLEPQPMIAEFMELFSGNRDQVIRRREPKPPAAPPVVHQPMPDEEPPVTPLDLGQPPITKKPVVATPVAETPADPLPPVAEPARPEPPVASDLFTEPTPPAPEPVKADFILEGQVVRTPTPKAQPETAFEGRPEVDDNTAANEPAYTKPTGRSPSRYAAPQPIDDDDEGFRFALPHIPRTVWRLLALGVVALVLLWLVISGLRALYNATMRGDDVTEPTPPAAAQTPATATSGTAVQPTATQPKNDRSLKTIPPLYID